MTWYVNTTVFSAVEGDIKRPSLDTGHSKLGETPLYELRNNRQYGNM